MGWKKESGLSKEEFEAQEIVFKIKKEQSTLICIKILQQWKEQSNT